jgi:hypothetical protein
MTCRTIETALDATTRATGEVIGVSPTRLASYPVQLRREHPRLIKWPNRASLLPGYAQRAVRYLFLRISFLVISQICWQTSAISEAALICQRSVQGFRERG